MDRFILDERRLFGAVLREMVRVVGGLEGGAIADGAVVGGGAVLDGGLQRGRVPAVQEVAVEAVARVVALREGEGAAVLVDVVDAVEDLVEEVEQGHLVRGRADAVVQVGHVFHVAVVGFVQVDAVPAGLEVDLCSQAVDAAGSSHARLLFAWRGVQASKADSVGFRTLAAGDQVLSVV